MSDSISLAAKDRNHVRVLSIVMLVLWICSAAAAEDALAQEDTATLWAALRAGGHVALVRHGATAGGAGDPPGFRLDDCATQRNLNDKGRAEARRLGEQFRGEDVAVGKLMSSPEPAPQRWAWLNGPKSRAALASPPSTSRLRHPTPFGRCRRSGARAASVRLNRPPWLAGIVFSPSLNEPCPWAPRQGSM